MSFWFHFVFLLINWGIATQQQGMSFTLIFSTTIFLTAYFSLPLMITPLKIVTFTAFPLLVLYTFWESLSSVFVWLIFLSLLIHFSQQSSKIEMLVYSLYLTLLVFMAILLYGDILSAFSFLLLSSLLTYALYELNISRSSQLELKTVVDSLKEENRQVKHQLLSGEQLIRKEERSEIAKELHDSVGHHLTALLMQLEVARVQSQDEQSKTNYQKFKELAQVSLKETRDAVYTLKSDKTSGLQAIILLVRKLEIESHLEINFVVQSGILSMTLTNDQSATLYRAIQESLTNMMRHSQTRKATIEFALLAKRVVQFKVSHTISEKVIINEGFGIKNMRKRLEDLNGTLQITQDGKTLTVIGKFPIQTDNEPVMQRNEE